MGAGGGQFHGGENKPKPVGGGEEGTLCEDWWGTNFRESTNMGHLLSQACSGFAPLPLGHEWGVGVGGQLQQWGSGFLPGSLVGL